MPAWRCSPPSDLNGLIAQGCYSKYMVSPSDADRFHHAIALIDQANALDPRQENWEGESHPKELLYSRRMTAWLERLEPTASELLRIAVRAQHICRWQSLRSDYPEGRAGYLRWRTDLYRFHAERAAEAMTQAGFTPAECERVSELLQKKRLKQDPEAQALEDVACLVFLEFYFADFAPGHDTAKVISILQKTWGKMSPHAQQAALAIPLVPEARQLVEKALSGGN